MPDLLAAATQEVVGQGGRRRTRIADSSGEEDDQAQSGRGASGRPTLNLNVSDDEEGLGREDAEEEESEPEGPLELEGWTIATFRSKPIADSSSSHRTIDAQRSQIDVAIETLDLHVKTLTEVGIAVEEARVKKQAGGDDTGADESQSMFEKLDGQVKETLDHIETLQIEKAVLDQLLKELQKEKQISDVKRFYKEQVDQRRELYAAKSEWAKFKNNDMYVEFRTSTWEVNNHGTPMPLMSEILNKLDDEDDSDIETGEATQSYNCPLTLRPFKDAYSCRTCKHIFEGEAIKEHIKAAPGNQREADKAAECPVHGCNKMIKLADIAPNPTFQKKVNRHFARLEERAQEQAQNVEVHEII